MEMFWVVGGLLYLLYLYGKEKTYNGYVGLGVVAIVIGGLAILVLLSQTGTVLAPLLAVILCVATIFGVYFLVDKYRK